VDSCEGGGENKGKEKKKRKDKKINELFIFINCDL
jgi:hypothetical protein